jgi:hypothetical protein
MIGFSTVVRRAHKAAIAHHEAQAALTEAFVERYAKTHSDLDIDELIDALDCGLSEDCPTTAEIDALMAAAGYPAKANRSRGDQ